MQLGVGEGYNVRKAAHVAAYFTLKAGGSIHARKLTTLAYLSDRLFLDRHNEPILFDHLVSGEHGPVGAMFQALLNGEIERPEWEVVIAARANHQIGLSRTDEAEDNLDELSEAEIIILNEIWNQFGYMDNAELSLYASTECPEWEWHNGAYERIPYSRIFKFLGRRELSLVLEDDIAVRMGLNATLARIDHEVGVHLAS